MCGIAVLIVMTRYPPCSKHAIVLRTVIFGAGMTIQDVVDDAEGDAIYVHEGMNAWECGCVETGYAGRRGCGCGNPATEVK
ncbi:MAG: hypothetical protein C5S48_05335 [Candidatus Methanogaster sp.]|nr:MAG: hypothetical protein C5S48_05335 [ANME-2 cluster archaeon]